MAKIKVDKQALLEAIKQARGMKTGICEILDIARPTLDRYLEDKEIKEAFDFAKVRIIDRAEYKLAEAVDKGESWAVMFALKNAKGRGYSDRIDVTSGDEPLQKYDQQEVNRTISAFAQAVGEIVSAKGTRKKGKVAAGK